MNHNVVDYFRQQAVELLGHSEEEPHFAYLNSEKDMLLPAQMRYPFVLFGHNGYQVEEDERHARWSVVLSVLAHVADTGSEREKNIQTNRCGRLLTKILMQTQRLQAKLKDPWLRGVSLSGATAMPIENADDALWGWAIEFWITLPLCDDGAGV